MYWSSFWAVLFFFMLILVGMGTQMNHLLVLSTALYDEFPKLINHKQKTTICIISGLFVIGLSMCTSGGFYIFQILERYGGKVLFF